MRPRDLIAACVSLVIMALAVVHFAPSGAAASSSSLMATCLARTPGATGAKLEFMQRECQRRATIVSGVTAQKALERKAALQAEARERELPTPTRLTGLVASRQGPPGLSQVFRTTTQWSGEIGAQWYLVYAGAAVNPTTNETVSSELRIYREPADINSGDPNEFVGSYVPPAGGSQPLTITAAAGDDLTIMSSGGRGSSLSFSVARRAFSTG